MGNHNFLYESKYRNTVFSAPASIGSFSLFNFVFGVFCFPRFSGLGGHLLSYVLVCKWISALRAEFGRIFRILWFPSTFITTVKRFTHRFLFSAFHTEFSFIFGSAGTNPESCFLWFLFSTIRTEFSLVSCLAACTCPPLRSRRRMHVLHWFLLRCCLRHLLSLCFRHLEKLSCVDSSDI